WATWVMTIRRAYRLGNAGSRKRYKITFGSCLDGGGRVFEVQREKFPFERRGKRAPWNDARGQFAGPARGCGRGTVLRARYGARRRRTAMAVAAGTDAREVRHGLQLSAGVEA